MNIEIDIPAKRIADLMVSAIEGNSMTRAWCSGVVPAAGLEKRINDGKVSGLWYADPRSYDLWFAVDVTEFDETGDEGDKVHRVSWERLKDGFATMAKKSPSQFGEFLADNEDATTADVFLQCVALGEVRYG